ncbi:TatD family hydrolase [Mycoplasmopsis felis]|uniref:TatD family hydrolase n=1 Tax=Mycoplasmopsis felis TaxID=33923 RepID=UPI0021AE905F|nr:TatD family hydrolase [Mycoplasmopsis felis]UWV80170.1 TatD family hydrolase [Mycoplasmopsis felis]
MNNGGHPKENIEVIELAKKYPVFKACIGIHPEAGKNANDYQEVEKLLLENRQYISGIGEIGLDYYYEDGLDKNRQIDSFKNQIKLADKYNLPAVIHIQWQSWFVSSLPRCIFYIKRISKLKMYITYICRKHRMSTKVFRI